MSALLRSWLYVPADDARKLAKAAGTDADVVILDLEDAVAGDRKAAARGLVARVLADTDFGRSRRYVRINAYDTPHWQADIEATAALRPDGYVLAKASSAEGVRAVAAALRSHLTEAEAAAIDLAAIVTEDVEGVFAMNDTIVADPGVGTVLWGRRWPVAGGVPRGAQPGSARRGPARQASHRHAAPHHR
jgi:citrate lyase subunit beta/citryl-CoA lyase